MCKQLTQSEHMRFSKNGILHSKGVVIIFHNDRIEIPTLTLPCAIDRDISGGILNIATLHHFTQ